MLKKLTIHDFLVLREPFESDRQDPGSLGVALLLCSFFQILMLAIEYRFMKQTYYPNAAEIFKLHLWLSVALIILSLAYVIPSKSLRRQRMQYFLSIVLSQNLAGISVFISMFFLIGIYDEISQELLLGLTKLLLICGVFVLLVTSIRFYILLVKGAYRKGSKKDLLRGKLEKNIGAYLPTLIASGTGISFIIYALSRRVTRLDFDAVVYVLFGVAIFYTMIFVLPEQLVILYCKFRFKSFNFDQNGNLYPVSKDFFKGKKKNSNRKKRA
ncbi:UNVERIFIED_ORG: membrane-associated HD superfamily phosphohydrolase [Heyndrickxia coagulans]